jgi:hypothetical protein
VIDIVPRPVAGIKQLEEGHPESSGQGGYEEEETEMDIVGAKGVW